jgi:hypothetical protein
LQGLAAVPLALALLAHGWNLLAALQAFTGGAIGGLTLIAFYRAMSMHLIGVVAPDTGLVTAALPDVAELIGGDELKVRQVSGIAIR